MGACPRWPPVVLQADPQPVSSLPWRAQAEGVVAAPTCAWHLLRVGVGAVVTGAADAVGGALVGGPAVNGTLLTLLIALRSLEEARNTSWREDTKSRRGEDEGRARRQEAAESLVATFRSEPICVSFFWLSCLCVS